VVRAGLFVDFGQFRDGVRSSTATNYEALLTLINGFVSDDMTLPAYQNFPFTFEKLQASLNLALYYEEAHGNKQIRDYCSSLVTRLQSVVDNPDYEFLRAKIPEQGAAEAEASSYVDRLLGLQYLDGRYQKKRQVCVVDLNDASDEIVELASSVVARMIFDRMRRADPRNKMPVHLILEEAHRYISESPSRFAIDAAQTFQRIAKEGRKYGVFLVVASQRPSELSKTVLSQCNNYIIHRIQNPDDLSQIRQMTPFISDTVLKRLPSLPKQHALIFGNAVNIPTTFRVRDATPTPNSNDTQIRDLWYVPADPKLEW
jgi:DNA helicase HerA-like ATPase